MEVTEDMGGFIELQGTVPQKQFIPNKNVQMSLILEGGFMVPKNLTPLSLIIQGVILFSHNN